MAHPNDEAHPPIEPVGSGAADWLGQMHDPAEQHEYQQSQMRALVESRQVYELTPDELRTLVQNGHVLLLVERFGEADFRRRGLMELSDDMAFLEWLQTESGVDDDTVQEALDQWFAQVGNALDQKLGGYHALISEASARADARKAAANRLLGLVKADQTFVGKLKDRLATFFTQRGLRSVDTPNGRLRVQANGGRQALKYKVEPEALPAHLVATITTVSPIEGAVRAALDDALSARQLRMTCILSAITLPNDANARLGARVMEDFQAVLNADWARMEAAGAPGEWGAQQAEDLFATAVIKSPEHLEAYITSLKIWEIVDHHFPPSSAEAVLAMVEYEPRGVHVRVE